MGYCCRWMSYLNLNSSYWNWSWKNWMSYWRSWMNCWSSMNYYWVNWGWEGLSLVYWAVAAWWAYSRWDSLPITGRHRLLRQAVPAG